MNIAAFRSRIRWGLQDASSLLLRFANCGTNARHAVWTQPRPLVLEAKPRSYSVDAPLPKNIVANQLPLAGLARPSLQRRIEVHQLAKRFVSYYGRSKDDEFLKWRSPQDSGLEYKPIGFWLFQPAAMCYALLILFLLAEVVLFWPSDSTYKDLTHVFVPEALLGTEYLGSVDQPSPLVLYHTIRQAVTQSIQARQGIQYTAADWALENKPLLVILGLCVGNYIGKRFGPHWLRQILVRYGYVRPDVYAVTGGKQRYDAPYLSLLTSAFSHRNIWHLASLASCFSVLALVVQQSSSAFNVTTLFAGGTLCGAATSLTLGTICAHAPVLTCGLGGAVAAMAGFLLTYFYGGDLLISVLRLVRQVGASAEEGQPAGAVKVMIPHFHAGDLRKAVAEITESSKAIKDDDYFIEGSDKVILAIVNKSPIVRSESHIPEEIVRMTEKDKDKKFILQMMILPPFTSTDTLAVMAGSAIFGIICVIGMFGRRVQNIHRASMDYAAMVGGLAFGMYVGRQTRLRVQNSKSLIVAMPMPLMNDYLVPNPVLAPHVRNGSLKLLNKPNVGGEKK